MNKQRLINSAKHIFTFGGGFATLTSVITDVLAPISLLGIFIPIAFFSAGVLVFIVGYFKPNLSSSRSEILRELWYAPLGLSLLIVCLSTGALYQVNQHPGNENGVLSNHVALIEDMQTQIGILQSIDITLEQSLDVQKESLQVQEQSLSVQKSTRNDISEIKGSGEILAFNLHTLHDALLRGDVGRLKQFNKQGFDLTSVYLSRGLVEAPLIIETVRYNKTNIQNVLSYLDEIKILDTNYLFEINPSYSTAYNEAWSTYMNKGIEFETMSKKGISFSEFRHQMSLKYGYTFPNNFSSIYEDPNGFSVIGAPIKAKVSLLTESVIHDNNQAIKWLNDNHRKPDQSKEYILMKHGVKILLSKYLTR